MKCRIAVVGFLPLCVSFILGLSSAAAAQVPPYCFVDRFGNCIRGGGGRGPPPSPPVDPQVERQREIDAEIGQGLAALDSGDATAAISRCSRALQLDPNSAQAHDCIGRANKLLIDHASAAAIAGVQNELERKIAVEKSQGRVQRNAAAARTISDMARDVEAAQAISTITRELEAARGGGREDRRGPVKAGPAWASRVAPYLEAHRGDIPMPFLLGWIAVESGGNLRLKPTSLGERGYFQLDPGESKVLKLEHERLSTDQEYSLQGGLALIGHYAELAASLGFSRTDDPDLFWHMVKFLHSMGPDAVRQVISDMRRDNVNPDSWSAISDYARANRSALFKQIKHNPIKWVNNVDSVFSKGSQLASKQFLCC